MRDKSIFRFKQFSIAHKKATMKVGTDGVLLGAWASVTNARRILDVGTGSGVIALMLAQRTQPDTHIDAIDISEDDCKVAQENVGQSPWPKKVTIQPCSLQELISEPYDVIVSNPPYFINSYKPPGAKRTRARHTETLSQHDLLYHSKRLLSPSGKLTVILPETEAGKLVELSYKSGWFCTRKCLFRSRQAKPVERVLLELSLQFEPLHAEELVLYESGENWSKAYKNLTNAFYLKA
ncbi:MAG: methyltransferase [Cyclobacteriaceae bacterium]|nr:methyltransferase [Cyclobacteriaceae bacterium]